MLEIRTLSVSYGPINALQEVSLVVKEGETVALLGANGAGKTTMLRAISGLVRPRSGAVTMRGQDLLGISVEKRVRLGLVHVPERRRIFGNLTVAENLAFPFKVRKQSRSEIEDKVQRALSMVQMSAFSNRRPSQLSGGQQQRVAVARALVFDP